MRLTLFMFFIVISMGCIKPLIAALHTTQSPVLIAETGDTSESDFGPEETDFC